MLQIKNSNNWPCRFQEEVKKVELLTHDSFDDARGRIKTDCNTQVTLKIKSALATMHV